MTINHLPPDAITDAVHAAIRERRKCADLRQQLGLTPLQVGEACSDSYRACRHACGKGKREWGITGGGR